MGYDDREGNMEGKNNPRNLEGKTQANGLSIESKLSSYIEVPLDLEAMEWICEKLEEEGMSLTGVCNEPRDFWPNGRRYSKATVYGWMLKSPAFAKRVALARSMSADTYFHNIASRVEAMTDATVTVDREKIRAWQWMAKVCNPRLYGDKLDVSADVMTHTQGEQTLDVSHLTSEQRDSLRSLLLAARRANDTGEDDNHTIDGQAIDVTPKP